MVSTTKLSVASVLVGIIVSVAALAPHNNDLSRREVLASIAAAYSALGSALPALAAEGETIDMNAINAARFNSPINLSSPPSVSGILGEEPSRPNIIIPMTDPPPLVRIGPKLQIQIPRVGYSLYKTPKEQAERCISLALRAGVRHFDLDSQYGSNGEVARALTKYLNGDMQGLDFSAENPELLTLLDDTRQQGEDHATSLVARARTASTLALSPTPYGTIGRKARRDDLFISHKLSNTEQSTDPVNVRRTIKREIAALGVQYLDLVSIHSPLTSKDERIETYNALLDLRDSGFVKSVGVCNYGVGALEEISNAGLEIPSINQVELSPFNQHADIVKWCQGQGVAIACGAWSRLSSTDGPQEGWSVVADMAKKKGMTKAQVLVRWSLQKGYICVPRSASASKIERIAIAENSYGGANPKLGEFRLTDEEMILLDGLDEGLKAGKLGRRDGWADEDVTGPGWDPTAFV